MNKNFLLPLALLALAPACDNAVDIDELEATEAEFNAEDVRQPQDADVAELNWEDAESIDLDGASHHASCRDKQEGDSWLAPGCFACICGPDGEASCYLAVCAPDQDISTSAHGELAMDGSCGNHANGDSWSDGCNDLSCVDGTIGSTRRACTYYK